MSLRQDIDNLERYAPSDYRHCEESPRGQYLDRAEVLEVIDDAEIEYEAVRKTLSRVADFAAAIEHEAGVFVRAVEANPNLASNADWVVQQNEKSRIVLSIAKSLERILAPYADEQLEKSEELPDSGNQEPVCNRCNDAHQV